MTDNIQTLTTTEKFEAGAKDSNRSRRGRPRIRREPASAEPAGAPSPINTNGASPPPSTKQPRRRRIDPTTFEKSYTDDEVEFMNAVQRFKNTTSHAHPTPGEILQIALDLGYRKAVVDGPGLAGHA
jgi:hypothetical protein